MSLSNKVFYFATNHIRLEIYLPPLIYSPFFSVIWFENNQKANLVGKLFFHSLTPLLRLYG